MASKPSGPVTPTPKPAPALAAALAQAAGARPEDSSEDTSEGEPRQPSPEDDRLLDRAPVVYWPTTGQLLPVPFEDDLQFASDDELYNAIVPAYLSETPLASDKPLGKYSVADLTPYDAAFLHFLDVVFYDGASTEEQLINTLDTWMTHEYRPLPEDVSVISTPDDGYRVIAHREDGSIISGLMFQALYANRRTRTTLDAYDEYHRRTGKGDSEPYTYNGVFYYSTTRSPFARSLKGEARAGYLHLRDIIAEVDARLDMAKTGGMHTPSDSAVTTNGQALVRHGIPAEYMTPKHVRFENYPIETLVGKTRASRRLSGPPILLAEPTPIKVRKPMPIPEAKADEEPPSTPMARKPIGRPSAGLRPPTTPMHSNWQEEYEREDYPALPAMEQARHGGPRPSVASAIEQNDPLYQSMMQLTTLMTLQQQQQNRAQPALSSKALRIRLQPPTYDGIDLTRSDEFISKCLTIFMNDPSLREPCDQVRIVGSWLTGTAYMWYADESVELDFWNDSWAQFEESFRTRFGEIGRDRKARQLLDDQAACRMPAGKDINAHIGFMDDLFRKSKLNLSDETKIEKLRKSLPTELQRTLLYSADITKYIDFRKRVIRNHLEYKQLEDDRKTERARKNPSSNRYMGGSTNIFYAGEAYQPRASPRVLASTDSAGAVQATPDLSGAAPGSLWPNKPDPACIPAKYHNQNLSTNATLREEARQEGRCYGCLLCGHTRSGCPYEDPTRLKLIRSRSERNNTKVRAMDTTQQEVFADDGVACPGPETTPGDSESERSSSPFP
jgi:hypothetical protein